MGKTVGKVNPQRKRVRFNKEFKLEAVRLLELGQKPATDLAMELANGPTIALGRTKHLINESLNRNLAEQLQAEQDSFAACAMTQDFARGVRAFVAKQKPGFLGN